MFPLHVRNNNLPCREEGRRALTRILLQNFKASNFFERPAHRTIAHGTRAQKKFEHDGNCWLKLKTKQMDGN